MFGIKRVAQRVASVRTGGSATMRKFVTGPPPGEAALSYTAQVKKIRLLIFFIFLPILIIFPIYDLHRMPWNAVAI